MDENLQTFWIRAWSEGCCYPAKAWRPQKYNTWEQPFQKSGWRNHFGEGYQKLLRKDTGILRCAKHIDIIHNLDLVCWVHRTTHHHFGRSLRNSKSTFFVLVGRVSRCQIFSNTSNAKTEAAACQGDCAIDYQCFGGNSNVDGLVCRLQDAGVCRCL